MIISHGCRSGFHSIEKNIFLLFPDLRIRRQHSSESMSSINSTASHSSMGSLGKDAEDKKKKKKSWVSWGLAEAAMNVTEKSKNRPQLRKIALCRLCYLLSAEQTGCYSLYSVF